MAWEIQLAFQGGGSRFMQHLAVASAFQKAEAADLIRINNVAGTSAGSLAAAIVAAGIPAEAAAKIIAANKRKYLSKLKIPNRLNTARRFLAGEPLLDIGALEEILRDVWALAGARDIKIFGQLKKPLVVMATDIVTRKPRAFEDSQEEIIPALLNSCAIPIIYRSLNHLTYQQNLVDGALVENLPLTKLVERKDTDGDVVAVTFAPAENYKKPENQVQYVATLVNIAISHSVEQVKRLVDRRHIFQIKTDLEPLDFKSALEDFGFGSENFRDLEAKASEWIRNNARSFDQSIYGRNAIPFDAEPSDLRMIEYLKDIFQAQHKDAKYIIKRRAIVVTAYSMLRKLFPNDHRAHQSDEVNQFYFIEPDTEPLYCMPIRMYLTTQNATKLSRSITITQKDGGALKSIVVPLGGPGENPQQEEALIFFVPVLRPDTRSMFPIKIRSFALIEGAMQDLALGKRDYVSIHNNANCTIETADVVLAVPRGTPHVKASWRVDDDPNVFVRGNPMTESDLNNYYSDLLPGDFRLMGWNAPNLGRQQRLYVNLELTGEPYQPPHSASEVVR